MKIKTLGRGGIEVTDDLKALFDKKLAKYDKFFKDDAEATVTLRERKNGRKVIELTIVSCGTIYRAENEEETFQNCLDRNLSAIERQIRKNKTKLQKRLKEGAFDQPAEPTESYEDFDEEENETIDIREKSFVFKPMSVEEAILQMDLLNHQFFVFENDETHEINVVYKRHTNKYGLIKQEK